VSGNRASGLRGPQIATNSTTTTSTTQDVPTGARRRVGVLDPRTYALSLHLVTDAVVGTAAFTLMVTLLAVSGALMITLLGIPLLVGTLRVARAVGDIERSRADTLPGSTARAREHPRHDPNGGHGLNGLNGLSGWRDALMDAGDWRAVAYSLLLFPLGMVAGTVTVAGWATAAAAVTAPAFAGRFDDSSRQLAGIQLDGPIAAVLSVAAGIALLMVMPTIVRHLARVQLWLVRRLLT
jgi:hypothetical protein